MSKIMPLELLSSIKGATSSEAIAELFKVIKQAAPADEGNGFAEAGIEAVSIEELRSDIIERCPETEKEIIRKNFPATQKGYLVVPKVIED